MALITNSDIIVNAWKNLRANAKQYSELVLWLILLGAAEWALDVVLKSLVPDKQQHAVVLLLAVLPLRLAETTVMIGMMDVAVKTLQRQSASVRGALAHGVHSIIPFLWVTFLYCLVTFGGLLLFVIPGLYFMIRYKFSGLFTAIDGVRGSKALAMSAEITRGRWWSALWRSVVPIVFFSLAFGLAGNLLQLVLGSLFGDPGLFFGNVAGLTELPAGYALVATIAAQALTGYMVVLLLCSDILLWLSLKKEAASSTAA